MYFFVSFSQLLKVRQCTLDHLRTHAVRRTEIPWTAEVRARYKQQIELTCACTERRIVLFECLWKEIERPLRTHTFKPSCRQPFVEQLCIMCVCTQISSLSRTACNDKLPE